MLYAAGLRHQADDRVVRLWEEESEADEVHECAAAASLFRRAAGVYEFVDGTVLTGLDESDQGCRCLMFSSI